MRATSMRWRGLAVILALGVGAVAGASPGMPHTSDVTSSAASVTTPLDDDAALADRGRIRQPRPGFVTFTFDDGPRVDTTDRVLDALAQYDVPATFFVVTKRLRGQGSPERVLVQRMLDDGHLLGSHSVSHRDLTQVTAAELRGEIDRSVRALSELAGRPIWLFRPPFGALGTAGAREVRARRLTDVRWTIDTRDFEVTRSALLRQQVSTAIVRNRGGIVLLHDAHDVTARAVPLILADLERHNCDQLARGLAPIVPVSLHYFLGDLAELPEGALHRTARYLEGLQERCGTPAVPGA